MGNVALHVSDLSWKALAKRAGIEWEPGTTHVARGIGKYINELATHRMVDTRRGQMWTKGNERLPRMTKLAPDTVALLAAHAQTLGVCRGHMKCLDWHCFCSGLTDRALAGLLLEAIGCGTVTPSERALPALQAKVQSTTRHAWRTTLTELL